MTGRAQIPHARRGKDGATVSTVETVDYVIDLGWLLQQLGHKAIDSKSGKAQTLNGAVRVRHVRPKKS